MADCNENIPQSAVGALEAKNVIAPAPNSHVNAPMRSMTGYGSGNAESKEYRLTIEVEITSVNRKSLDVQLSAPKEWTGLEQKCSEWLKGSFERGRVNLQIRANQSDLADYGLQWNEKLMAQALGRLKSFAESQEIAFEPDSQTILQLAQSLREASAGLPDWREIEATIEDAFQAALKDQNLMRSKEGESLKVDLKNRIVEMTALTKSIESHAFQAPAQYEARLLERLAEMELDLDLSDERVLKEVAIFADRSDVSEEITRLKSHFELFDQLLESGEPSGRKMDFLCQEIHREFNTTGSKAQQIEVKRAVIEGKNSLERVREQVQNIE